MVWINRRSHCFSPKRKKIKAKRQNRRFSLAFVFVPFLFVLVLIRALYSVQTETFSRIDGELRGNKETELYSRAKFHGGGISDSRAGSRSNSKAEGIPDESTIKTKLAGEGRNSGVVEQPAESQSINDENESTADEQNTKKNKADNNENKDNGDQIKVEEGEDMYFRDPNAAVADWDYFPPKREPRRDISWNQATRVRSSLSTLNKEKCDQIMNIVDTSPPPRRKPSNKACEGYDGVFHIHHFDEGGASGTAFFQFAIGMMAWADQHNYLPWIHMEDGYTIPIWDPIVHMNVTKETSFEMQVGMEIGWARDPADSQWHIFPGKPFLKKPLRSKTFALKGTGVWEHYFLPPTDFVPGDISCQNKPIVRMNDDHIAPGIHYNAPWAPRAWRTSEVPNILLSALPWDQWFKPQRKHGAEMTKRYIRFNPMIERRAHCAFPNPEFSLGMHIRHGDKYIERDIIKTDVFLKFAKVFVDNGGGHIYVATDSAKVLETIFEEWPKDVVSHVVHQPSVMGLTSNKTAAFNLGVSAHRTNAEALTDVLALSKSTFFLHGLSAMSEAVFYLNPGLVERSLNLEDKRYRRYRPEFFVKVIMPLGKEKVHNE